MKLASGAPHCGATSKARILCGLTRKKGVFKMVSRHCAWWMCGVGTVLLVLSPSHAVVGAETITNGIGMKLVLVPAGEFMMGSEESRTDTLNYFPYCDPKWLDGELPRHKVRITKPFYMGQYSVMLNEFLTFYHDAHYKLEMERDGKPSWGYNAGNGFNRITQLSPLGSRLGYRQWITRWSMCRGTMPWRFAIG